AWQIIKNFQPNAEHTDLGYCFERSFLMFMCLNDALWVNGKNKSLELAYGKDDAYHAWVEVGNYVYDPTTLSKYQKDLYYKMLKVSDVVKITHDDVARNPDKVKSVSKMLTEYLNQIGKYEQTMSKDDKNTLEISFDY
ncbi:MAG: hypothetical protein J5598_02145, partial [Clostridia bacterium]|nr:hypothetical protein [Clostridia bacterium]